MKKLFWIGLFLLATFSTFDPTEAFAATCGNDVQCVDVAIKSDNLVPTLKRLTNQYDLESVIDYTGYQNSEQVRVKGSWILKNWEQVNTGISQDVVTGEYVFTIRMPIASADRLPKNDTPNFITQRSDEMCGEDLCAWPTYSVYTKDIDGNIIGTHLQTMPRIK